MQKLQFVFEWVYLLLAVNPRSGELKWEWIERMRQEDLIPVLSRWQLDGVIWDGASSHRGSQVAQLPLKRIFQPPYSPELSRAVEGLIYSSLQAKKQAVETELRQLAGDPEQVKRLSGWGWLCAAFDGLPAQ